MTNQDVNEFIYFLKEQTFPQTEIELSAFYNMNHPKINVPQIINELRELKFLHENGGKMSLKNSIVNEIENLPAEYKGKPYEYFVKQQQTQKTKEKYISELQFEKLKDELIDLQNRLKNFKPSNRRANLALLLSAISVVIAAIALYLKLTGQ